MSQHRLVVAISMIAVLASALVTISLFMNCRELFSSFEVKDTPLVRFMEREHVRNFLLNDDDGYIKSLSPADLHARKSSSTHEYLRKAADSVTSFTEEEKKRLKEAVMQANTFIMRNLNEIRIPGVKHELLYSLPWIFAKTNSGYEEGYPHTRKNIIFLGTTPLSSSDNKKLVQTLIHEKVHVYQRQYPQLVKQYAESLRCEPSMRRSFATEGQMSLLRSNPDLDMWIYQCDLKRNGNVQTMMSQYSSEYPNSIGDVTSESVSMYEHPYEHMAYFVASLFD